MEVSEVTKSLEMLSHVSVATIPHCYPESGGKFRVLFKPVEWVLRKSETPILIRSKREEPVQRQVKAVDRLIDERHYSINELHAAWRFSRKTIIECVDKHAGRFPSTTNAGFGKRIYRGRRVPESLVQEIYAELCANSYRKDDNAKRILPTPGIQMVAGIRIGRKAKS
jgi:hypothetical protein